MALITPGPLVAEIRGSVGGTTFSRNRHGMYTRARAIPVNPTTPSQVLARSRFNQLATYWRDTLVQAQRDAWDVYAKNTPWTNAVGQSTLLTGMNHFVRSNTALLQIGEAVLVPAPVSFGLPDQEVLWGQATDATLQNVAVVYTFDTSTDDQHYLFYQGQPVPGSHTFFAGPWRYLGVISGDAGSPPTSPETFPCVYPVGAGQNSFVYCRRIDPDGRLTEPFRYSDIVS